MPIYASAFFIPTSASIPYILEDIYVRGGYRSVANIAERDAIKAAARKQGMLCYVRDEQVIYWLPNATTSGPDAWKVLDVTKYVNYKWQEPLAVDEEFNVTIDEKRLVPLVLDEQAGMMLLAGEDGTAVWTKYDALPTRDGALMGSALVLDAELNMIWAPLDALPPRGENPDGSALVLGPDGPEWGTVDGLPDRGDNEDGAALVLGPDGPEWGSPVIEKKRVVVETVFGEVGVGLTRTAAIDIPGNTCLIVGLTVHKPDVELNLHSTQRYDDPNPYTFISSIAKITDDGISVGEDGEMIRHRRYSIYNDATGSKRMFVQVTNNGTATAEIRVSVDVLPME